MEAGTAGNKGEGARGSLAEGRSKRFFFESVLSCCWHVRFERNGEGCLKHPNINIQIVVERT